MTAVDETLAKIDALIGAPAEGHFRWHPEGCTCVGCKARRASVEDSSRDAAGTSGVAPPFAWAGARSA